MSGRRRYLGGVVEIYPGCPAGLGEPVFDKMDADLAARDGIGGKAEIGDGCVWLSKDFRSTIRWMRKVLPKIRRHSGHIATGQDMILGFTASPFVGVLPQQTVDSEGQKHAIKIQGRHDICVLPRIVPVCEAMVCLVLADHWLRQKAVRL